MSVRIYMMACRITLSLRNTEVLLLKAKGEQDSKLAVSPSLADLQNWF